MDNTQSPSEPTVQQPQEMAPPQDLIQAVPDIPAMPTSAGAGWLTGKLIAIIVGIVVIAAGTGGYFLFFDDSSPAGISNNVGSNSDFDCKDLLPDSDFQRIIGISPGEYKLVVTDTRPDLGESNSALEGLKQAPGVNQDLEFASGTRMLTCSYFSQENEDKDQAESGNMYSIFGDVTFMLITRDGGMMEAFEIVRDPYKFQGDGTYRI